MNTIVKWEIFQQVVEGGTQSSPFTSYAVYVSKARSINDLHHSDIQKYLPHPCIRYK
jgi:hypothetical protein